LVWVCGVLAVTGLSVGASFIDPFKDRPVSLLSETLSSIAAFRFAFVSCISYKAFAQPAKCQQIH